MEEIKTCLCLKRMENDNNSTIISSSELRQKQDKPLVLPEFFACGWFELCFLLFPVFFQDVRKTDPTKNETVVGEHLKFERKDVWDMKWADVSSCEN